MVKVSSLNKKEENPIFSANNSILGAIPIGTKLSLQESQKSLDPSTTSKGSGSGTTTADPVFNTVGVADVLTVDKTTILAGTLSVSSVSNFSDDVTFEKIIRCGQINSLLDSRSSLTEPAEQINLDAHVINIGTPSSIVNIFSCFMCIHLFFR